MRSVLPKETKDYCEDCALDVLMVENEQLDKTTIAKTIYLYDRLGHQLEIQLHVLNEKGELLHPYRDIRVNVKSLITALNRIQIKGE